MTANENHYIDRSGKLPIPGAAFSAGRLGTDDSLPGRYDGKAGGELYRPVEMEPPDY